MHRQSLLIGWSKQFTIAKFFDACMKIVFPSQSSKICKIKGFGEFLGFVQ
jgi:hypothetical protein